MNIFVLGALALIGSICPNQTRPVNIPPKMEYYLSSKDAARHAFFKFDKNRDGRLFEKDSRPYNLCADDVLKIEDLITKRVTLYNKTASVAIKQPGKYYKQFIAIINTKGEKEVWVNCCCSVQNSWKNQIQRVEDGGKCYFQLNINLTTNLITEFRINGVA